MDDPEFLGQIGETLMILACILIPPLLLIILLGFSYAIGTYLRMGKFVKLMEIALGRGKKK